MRLLALAGLALLAAPGGARAVTPPAVPLGTSVEDAAADLRWAAFAPDPATVRVIDTAAGTTRDVATPPSCSFRDLGGGHLLWACNGSRGPFERVVDLRSGVVRDAPADSAFLDAQPDEVGSYWIRADDSEPHFSSNVYIYWRSERTEHPTAPGSRLDDARVVEDLNASRLTRPLCKPLRRVRNPHYIEAENVFGEPYQPMSYERPTAVRWRADGGTIELLHCGSRRVKRVRGGFPVLRAGLLTWVDGDFVRGRVLATGRRFAWNWRKLAPAATGALVEHTARRVYITTVEERRLSVFEARWR